MNHLLRGTRVILVVCALLPAFAHAQSPAPALAPAEPVMEAKFDKNIGTKSAKPQDTVVAKTLREYKLADGTDLPKGTKLVGKVVTVQSKKEGNGDSMLTFRFDEADVKGGASVPIHGLVVAIGPSLAPDTGLGQGSALARGGQGSTPGLDPNAGLGKAGKRDEDDIAMGSTLEGVALGVHKDGDWTTALKGFKMDIELDSDVRIKVQLK